LRDLIEGGVRALLGEDGFRCPQLLVSVTNDEPAVRARIAEQFAIAGQVPEYRAMLDREHAAGPQDVAVLGDENTVARYLQRLADAGVTDFIACPFGGAVEQGRTVTALADIARSTHPATATPAR
jgi:hypothetical protein